jgi:hypothetical protein
MTTFTVMRNMDMSAEKVWNVFSDFEHSPIPSCTVTVEKKGDPRALGVGTIRMITIGKRQIREKLESLKPPNQLTYSLLSGGPVKDYNGTIDINSIKGKTHISWKVNFKPTIIGTGWIIKQLLKSTLNRFINEIETEFRD